jgi:HPt (histidine-containing phosphotransfer) domain-containing protein
LPPAADRQLIEVFLRDVKNAVEILESLSKLDDYGNEDSMNTYVVTTHGMKSALANIGEMELSSAALKLETAGREKRVDIIKDETPAFLDSLLKICKALTPREKSFNEENEDKVFLKERLLTVKTACEEYQTNAASDALNELRAAERVWSRATEELLETISANLLHGDYEAVVTAVNQLLGGE